MTGTTLAGSGSLSSLGAVSPGLIVVVVVLGALELVLAVIALVVLIRTPRQRVTLPKWAWALLIIFINLIGSILFLAIGRRPAQAVDPRAGSVEPGAAARPSASNVADSLYGGAPAAPAPEPREADSGAAPDAGAPNGGGQGQP